MSESFIGEVRAFPYQFAPAGWLECQGQLVPVSQYQALFTVLGSRYGGDQRTTFGLPDLRGRGAIGQGQGPGLANYVTGQLQGVSQVTLGLNQLPNHTHDLDIKYMGFAQAPNAFTDTPGTQTYPSRLLENTGAKTSALKIFKDRNSSLKMVSMSHMAVSAAPPSTQATQPHENCQPYLAMRFCICYEGIYPVRE